MEATARLLFVCAISELVMLLRNRGDTWHDTPPPNQTRNIRDTVILIRSSVFLRFYSEHDTSFWSAALTETMYLLLGAKATQLMPYLWPGNSATQLRSWMSQTRTEGRWPHSPVTRYRPSSDLTQQIFLNINKHEPMTSPFRMKSSVSTNSHQNPPIVMSREASPVVNVSVVDMWSRPHASIPRHWAILGRIIHLPSARAGARTGPGRWSSNGPHLLLGVPGLQQLQTPPAPSSQPGTILPNGYWINLGQRWGLHRTVWATF